MLGISAGVGKGLKGPAHHRQKTVRRSTSTHRVVCEPLQDDGSGEGKTGRKGKAPVRSGLSPTPPTRVRSRFWGGGLGSPGTRPSNKGATSPIQGDEAPAQVFGRGECGQYGRTHVLLNKLDVAEVCQASHSAALLLRHRRWLPGPALLPAGTAGQRSGPPRSALPPRPPGAAHHPPSPSESEPSRAGSASVQITNNRSSRILGVVNQPPRGKPGALSSWQYPGCRHGSRKRPPLARPERGGISGK